MKTIRLETWMNAPVERCFKLSLSVDLHLVSARQTRERVTSGVRSGLLGLDDTVAWAGRHFGIRFRHTSLIDQLRPYMYFRDVMVEGIFSSFQHEHHFAVMNDGTRMRDELRFSAPTPLAWAIEPLLRRHLIRLLKRRNATIKRVAESSAWRNYLSEVPPHRPSQAAEREWSQGEAIAS